MSDQSRDPEHAIAEVAALGELLVYTADGIMSEDKVMARTLATVGDRLTICADELYGHLDVRAEQPDRLVRAVVRAVGD